MTDKEILRRRVAAVRSMLDIPYFTEMWDELERSAVNACINAAPTDNETRSAYAAEARAIRKFRSRLNFILEEAKAANNAPA
ncbi:hypothetical protein DEM27_05730 [Metarhizobium album]|uniref:Uncharacterized protein n=1 Tax=Metarhizobium album TaxID=2182425 RepID=A0A2U2DV10_9HYPH|nr:hypothetical protein [Rhizobium album]PWE57140.1 hypothetical protein DEM27_05730 [Rhizobium album]